MKLFKITDERDLSLDGSEPDFDEMDTPLIQFDAELNLDDKFGVDDDDFDALGAESELDFGNGDLDDDELDTPLIMDDQEGSEVPDEEMTGDFDELDPEADPEAELDPEAEVQEDDTDPDYQGIIRNVKGAFLIYKRQEPDDTYSELWIYNVGKDMKKESQIRRAILAGTDIDPSVGGETQDGTPSLSSYNIGNVAFLQLNNLSN